MKSLLLLGLAGTLATAPVPCTLTELGGGPVPQPARLANSVVLIIDAQCEYTIGRLPLREVEAALRQTARLLARARAAGVPIVHIQQVSPPGGRLFDPQDTLVAFAPEAMPARGEIVISKRMPNAFAGTTLDAVLRKTGRENIIISGYMTHMCVSATARVAFDLGYKTTVIADACATRDLADGRGNSLSAGTVHRVALAELRDRFSTVVETLDEIPD